MSISVRSSASPALATSALIQSAVAVLRSDAHTAATDRVWSRAAARGDTTIIAVLAALLSSDAKRRVGIGA